MAFRKLSDISNDTGLAIDLDTNRLARWDGREFIVIADPAAVPLPDAPTEDGKYVLTVSVEDGAATFEWEAQTPPDAGGGE